MTYSIVARDAATGALGVAVQSHWFSVGSVVPAAQAGVGAVATQAFAERSYGPLGVERMRSGEAPVDALGELLLADPGRELRQVALVAADGRVAVHTGSACVQAAGHATGEGVSAQGNMLARPGVPEAMVAAYESAGGGFPERLLAALDAAEALGGDARGRQSAALLVVGEEPVDVRVDDHPDPLAELRRLHGVAAAYSLLGAALDVRGSAVPEQVDEALGRLERAQAALGDNVEPTFWRSVLLAEVGRYEEARAALERAAEVNPLLPEFFGRLVPTGFLSEQQVVETLR